MKIKTCDILFVILSVVNVGVMYIFGSSILTYALMVFLILLKIGNIINNEEFLLYSLFVPNKYLQLLSVLLFLLFSKKLFSKKWEKNNATFILYILFVGVANCLIYQGPLFNVIFQGFVYYCILRMLDIFYCFFSVKEIIEIFDKMFCLQIFTIALEFLITHETEDALTGTLISAHYLGVFLVVYAFLLLKIKRPLRRKKITDFLRMLVLLVCIYLIDAKHIVAIFALSMALAGTFQKLKIKNRFTGLMLGSTAIVAMLLCLINSGVLNEAINQYSVLATYITNSDYNKKIEFYINTFEHLKGIHGLIGYGVGLYGSQICITLAKGIIYSWNPNFRLYVYAITPYANAITGIMTEWYTNTGIVISSMVLGYPLVSYVALIAELGVVGVFLFMQILDKKYKDSYGCFITMFLLLIHFDTYFEIPCVFVMILIAENISNERKLLLENELFMHKRLD